MDGVGDTFPGTAVGEAPTSGSAGATVQVAGLTGFKQIVSTSLTETGKDQFLPNLDDLAIGERITYRLEATFAEGTSNLVVVDNLPTVGGAMELLGFRIVDVGGNLSAPSAPVATQVDTDGDGRPDQLTIDFGTIFNAPDGIIDRNDTAAILVEAIVVDDLRNQAGDVLVNTAQAFVNGALVGTGTASAEVVEPDLIIDKATSAATGDAGRRDYLHGERCAESDNDRAGLRHCDDRPASAGHDAHCRQRDDDRRCDRPRQRTFRHFGATGRPRLPPG